MRVLIALAWVFFTHAFLFAIRAGPEAARAKRKDVRDMKTEQHYEKKFRYLYHETGKLSDAIADALERQNTLVEHLRLALGLAATEQVRLQQLAQQASNAMTEVDDL